jgi:hypothetical protein
VIKKVQGTVHGKTIEVTEDLGLADGEKVEVTIERVTTEGKKEVAPLSEGLAKVYGLLGERYASGHTDTAARHNEHQP